MSFIYQSLLGSFYSASILAVLLLPGAALMSFGIQYWRNRKGGWRWLHLFYILLFALYLEWVAMVIAYWLLFELKLEALPKVLVNPVFLWFYMLFFAFAEERLFREKQAGLEEHGPLWFDIVSDRKQMRIDLHKLIYIESKNEQCYFHFEDKVLVSRDRISKLSERLPEGFMRIHRSFIVNLDQVQTIHSEELKTAKGELPVSRTYRPALEAYQKSLAS